MIVAVIGTNAEMLRLHPVLERLKDFSLILTGQNTVEAYGIQSNQIIQLEGFSKVGTSTLRGVWKFLSVKRNIAKALHELRPDLVVYQGDTVSTLAASLAADAEDLPRAHVEAGFRSSSWREPFPEELCRRWADDRSTMMFAPSDDAFHNLQGRNVRKVGSTVWDNVNENAPRKPRRGDYAVMTAHRYENILVRSRLKRVVAISKLPKLPLVWPMHEMTRVRLKDAGLLHGVEPVELMSYPEFMELVAGCAYVITDGGGLEDEASIMRKPCIVIRNRTERREVQSRLVGLDTNRAEATIRKAESDPWTPPRYPYYFGTSPSDLISEAIQE